MLLERWREVVEALRGVGVVVHDYATHLTLIGQMGVRVPTFLGKSLFTNLQGHAATSKPTFAGTCSQWVCKAMQPPGGWLSQHHAASRFAGSCSHVELG